METHLKYSIYEDMKQGMDIEAVQKKAIVLDGFEKIQKRTRHLKLAVGIVSGLLIVLLCSVVLALFVIGKPIPTARVKI